MSTPAAATVSSGGSVSAKPEEIPLTECLKDTVARFLPLWNDEIAPAIKSGKREDLNADIEEGHLSSALMHLANISYRIGRSIEFDPVKEQIVRDTQANAMLRDKYRAPFVVPEKV